MSSKTVTSPAPPPPPLAPRRPPPRRRRAAWCRRRGIEAVGVDGFEHGVGEQRAVVATHRRGSSAASSSARRGCRTCGPSWARRTCRSGTRGRRGTLAPSRRRAGAPPAAADRPPPPPTAAASPRNGCLGAAEVADFATPRAVLERDGDEDAVAAHLDLPHAGGGGERQEEGLDLEIEEPAACPSASGRRCDVEAPARRWLNAAARVSACRHRQAGDGRGGGIICCSVDDGAVGAFSWARRTRARASGRAEPRDPGLETRRRPSTGGTRGRPASDRRVAQVWASQADDSRWDWSGVLAAAGASGPRSC